MMDHARHLSSPSPTSPFLFHHSERSSFSKSNPLTPLLSSTAVDVSSVDDCFSSPTPTPTSHHNHHSNTNNHHHQQHNHNHHHHHQQQQSNSPFEVVDQRSQSPLVHHHIHHSNSNHLQHHHHNNNNNNNNIINNNNHHHLHHNGSTSNLIHHHSDSLTGVDDEDDDDDGMHNMLSGGSSSSSTSTMPLLTESHSHHSFSRISLEEYSPLSLVEDCDNALPISPTSLACASHHSFKSSLNGLNKIDNLVVGVGDDHDVDVNDARSLSPSLLSSSSAHHHSHHHHHHHHHQQQQHHHHNHHNQQHHHQNHHLVGSSSSNNHHNLWSNSSTAISQNTSILNNHSSTSFLLNQHHQQQLNSLMQQLEPQSLDEPPQPPCLISSNSSSATNFDGHIGLSMNSANLLSSSINLDIGSSTVAHRPSSEPPPSCGGAESVVSDIECKSLNGQQLTTANTANTTSRKQARQKQSNNKTNSSNQNSVQSTPTRPRRNRNKSSAAAAAASKQTDLNNKKAAEAAKEQQLANSSKVHLQLNHHKKLEELQRRLFGTQTCEPEAEIPVTNDNSNSDNKKSTGDDQASALAGCSKASSSSYSDTNECIKVKQEPDSSQAISKEDTSSEIQQLEIIVAVENKATTGVRPSRNRRSRAQAKISTAAAATGLCKALTTSKVRERSSTQKIVVATEKVEPDTTTKSSSDCTKLADLLSNTSSSGGDLKSSNNTDGSFSNNNNVSISIQGPAVAGEAAIGIESGGDKRAVQTTQVQMSPSLTVMAANATGLIQPITIQPQQQQQQPHDNGSSGLIATSNSGGGATTFNANQVFCRSQLGATGNDGGAQLKGILSSNELLKGAHNDNVMTTWTLQPANPYNNNNNGVNQNSANNNQQQATIGTHQIAIQVICQDGTSLVLPVSSAAGLNAAVSLTSQHQQLQAVLASNAALAVNQQQRNNNSNQSQPSMIPLMSVSNIVAQQQQTSGIDSSPTTSSLSATFASSSANTNSGSHASSGLAASSPTLAALLDAGSTNRSGANNDSSGGQSFVSSNLLRKLVSGGIGNGPQRIQIKRADPNQLGQTTDVTFTTLNGGSLVISSPAASANVSQPEKQKSQAVAAAGGEKRVKLENSDVVNSVNVQATFTLVDSQGLVITGDLDKSSKQAQLLHQTTSNGGTTAATSTAPANQQQQSVVKVNSDTWKQTKMGSSTGNRQVDPTQPFRCEHCNSTFTRLGNFTRHKKIHTVPTKDGQRFKCDVCSKSFLQRCDLARHLHIHRGTEPHRCNICGKGYIRHSDLVTHQRFHNKEKPFGCPQCSKGFCQRGDLNRHLRSIHLQMKPILCPCCNRKFAKQETLLRHLNTAHRSKPGTASTAVIAKLSPNYPLAPGDDKQQQTPAITVVTNAVALNNDNNIQKNATVASLQAIQATLCNIPQSVDPSKTSVSSPIITTRATGQVSATSTTKKAAS